MNTLAMAQSAYASGAAPVRTERGAEYDAFARITHSLKSAAAPGGGYPGLVRALHDNRQLWTVLAGDVAESENQLPAPLRAQIFYLYEFTQTHTSKVLSGDAAPDILVEINTAVMRGLRAGGAK